MPEASRNHPVWGVYDLYRTARLNVKYYAARLHELERYNFFLELVIAITAPGSAIAGLWFLETPLGKELWKYLGLVAAIAAILKPILSWPKKIKAYNELLSGYRLLEHDMWEIKEMVAQKGKYNQELQADYKKALNRKRALTVSDPETTQNKKLISKFEAEVNQELPLDQFFVPSE